VRRETGGAFGHQREEHAGGHPADDLDCATDERRPVRLARAAALLTLAAAGRAHDFFLSAQQQLAPAAHSYLSWWRKAPTFSTGLGQPGGETSHCSWRP